jgi:hypothetical protein
VARISGAPISLVERHVSQEYYDTDWEALEDYLDAFEQFGIIEQLEREKKEKRWQQFLLSVDIFTLQAMGYAAPGHWTNGKDEANTECWCFPDGETLNWYSGALYLSKIGMTNTLYDIITK